MADDIIDELNAMGKEMDKDAEIERILAEFRLDAYSVLGLQPGVPDSDIKKVYRAKSLLIHPDKTKNPKAPDAFDRLKKAQTELLDEKKRKQLDSFIDDARYLLMKEKKLTKDDTEVMQSEEFLQDWREKTKWVIMDNEKDRMKREKAMLREEGREARKVEEEMDARKRKREHEQAWEDTREQRIDSWRDFKGGANGGNKKKKKKVKVLG
ncbi:DnaJ-domain-containing protein [Polyplosphaeria fusca]|uniref:DnaJ-domain-containing protein n=1 Tax=Polyplosphaeria fusca TaxID=682080 RepID=A0A9P4V6L8_9PLEO|nr:DnaJ-domain-containing protein [Polyplosphaeria fusca]